MSEAAPTIALAATAPAAPANTGVTDAPAAAQQTEAEQREKRRIVARELHDDDEFVLDVDGKEQVISAKEWRRNTQRTVSADQRYREAQQAREAAEEKERRAFAQADALRKDLTDPRRFRAAASQLGLNPRQLAEQLLQIEQEEAQLSPEQRKLREYERMFAEQQQRDQQQRRAAEEAVAEERATKLQHRFMRVMEMAGVPMSDDDTVELVLARMTSYADRIRSTEGRSPSIGETIQDIHATLEKLERVSWGRRAPSERIKAIGPEDWAEYQRAQAAANQPTIAAAPRDSRGQSAANQPRQPNGQFATDNRGGQRTVNDIFSLYNK